MNRAHSEPPRAPARARRWPRAAAASAGVLLCGVIVAGVVDDYCAHGLDATYYVSWGRERLAVHRTVEHRTSFGSAHRPLSRYIQNWDFESWGIPPGCPPLDVELSGTLTVPPGAPVGIALDPPHAGRVEVDGRTATALPIDPGTHRVRVIWRSPPEKTSSLRMRWTRGRLEGWTVSRRSFRPDTRWPVERTWTWAAIPAVTVLLALYLFFAVVARDRQVRTSRLVRFSLVLVLLVGAALRLWDYAVVPEFRENNDELYATWNGWSILEDGTTRGWTAWPELYGPNVRRERIFYFHDQAATSVSPYFEHPPLMHILVGAAAHLGGARHFLHARLQHTRLVPIGLGLLCILLIYAVGRRIDRSGPATALLGAAFYAAVPLVLIQNRAIKEEALLAPLALAGLWFFLRWRDEGERWRDLLAAALLCGLCALTKVPGIAFVVALGILVAERRRYLHAVVVLVIGVAIAALFLLEGALIDWSLFVEVQTTQATIRGTIWNVFLRFIHMPFINHNVVGRGWLLFFWLSWAATVARGGKHAFLLTVPLLVYLVTIGLASGFWSFGWYWLPLYPFLCLAAGRFIRDLWDKPGLFGGFLLVGVFAMYFMNFTEHPAAFNYMPFFEPMRRAIQWFSLGFIGPFVIAQLFPWRPFRRLARLSTVVVLLVSLGLAFAFVYEYDRLSVTHEHLDLMFGRDR